MCYFCWSFSPAVLLLVRSICPCPCHMGHVVFAFVYKIDCTLCAWIMGCLSLIIQSHWFEDLLVILQAKLLNHPLNQYAYLVLSACMADSRRVGFSLWGFLSFFADCIFNFELWWFQLNSICTKIPIIYWFASHVNYEKKLLIYSSFAEATEHISIWNANMKLN